MVLESEWDCVALIRTTHRRLNVGCGRYPMRFWLNLDSDPAMPAEIHADALEHLRGCEEGRYDSIYAGHFLEHLGYDDAKAFLFEAYRALASGGSLAIVVPDTREVMRQWLQGTPLRVEWPMGTWRDIADLNEVCHLFLYSDVQETPHRWAWEEATLARAMSEAGFVNLRSIDRYDDPRIPVGAWYQCGVEGYKPKEARCTKSKE